MNDAWCGLWISFGPVSQGDWESVIGMTVLCWCPTYVAMHSANGCLAVCLGQRLASQLAP